MMVGAFSTAALFIISFISVVIVIDLSSGFKVVPEFDQFWSRNRQPLFLPRWLDARSRGISGKANDDQFLHQFTSSEVGLNGELKKTRFPNRSSRDTTRSRTSSEVSKAEVNQPGILVYRPITGTGHVHLPESQTELLKNKRNWTSRRGVSTSRKSKREIAWIYRRQFSGTNKKNPGNIGEEFRLSNDQRELVDPADGAMYDATVTSSDGEPWKEIGNLVAAAGKSGYGVSLEVEPSDVASETDHLQPGKSKQKLEGQEVSDGKRKSSGNEDDDEADAVKSNSNAIIWDTNPINVWGKLELGANPVRVLDKRASGTSNVWDKRPWDTDTVRVWGKRAWEIDPVRVWGKRAWEMDPVRVWGKRAWEMDPVRVWGKRAWETDPARLGKTRLNSQ